MHVAVILSDGNPNGYEETRSCVKSNEFFNKKLIIDVRVPGPAIGTVKNPPGPVVF